MGNVRKKCKLLEQENKEYQNLNTSKGTGNQKGTETIRVRREIEDLKKTISEQTETTKTMKREMKMVDANKKELSTLRSKLSQQDQEINKWKKEAEESKLRLGEIASEMDEMQDT